MCQKSKIFERWPKNRTIFVKKSQHYVDDVIRTRETHIILNPTFLSKAILVLNVSARFEQDWIKDEEAAPN